MNLDALYRELLLAEPALRRRLAELRARGDASREERMVEALVDAATEALMLDGQQHHAWPEVVMPQEPRR